MGTENKMDFVLGTLCIHDFVDMYQFCACYCDLMGSCTCTARPSYMPHVALLEMYKYVSVG